ncbi:hypothetical protein P4T20_11425 [Aneurinibacillus thermoaerophilus]|nr:hypothetical protein [Aneurinibacillus thermoaerophilus]
MKEAVFKLGLFIEKGAQEEGRIIYPCFIASVIDENFSFFLGFCFFSFQ